VATYTLATLMGITEAALPEKIKFPEMSAEIDEQISAVEVYIDTALANRPDLKGYREAVGSAEYTLYSRWGAFSPTVTFNSGWNYYRGKTQNDMRYGQTYQGASQYDTILNQTQFNYGGTVSWTLFDGTYRIMRVREAQALLAQSQYTLAAKWIEVVQDVRSAYDNLLTSRKQAILYKKTLVYVTKQRDLVEEEYKAGNTELTRLNEAQNTLVSAQSKFVNSLVNVHNAKAQLEAAINSN
jgi:outer membrane protein TolC